MLHVSDQTCLRLLREAGHGLLTEAVVDGPAAAALAIEQPWKLSQVSVVVPQEFFDYLASQDGWTAEGNSLVNAEGALVVNILPEYHITERRAWQTSAGVQVACLPETFVALENHPDANQRMTMVREALQVPMMSAPAERATAYLMPDIEQLCPPEWQFDSALTPYLRLMAIGMHTVNTCYGDPEVQRANQIVGDVERPEYGVRALYHNGFDLFDDLQWLLKHLQLIGMDPRSTLLALCGDVFSDAVFGNGRKRNNPESYDELRSAALVRARAMQVGIAEEDAQRLFDIVLGTTFSWQTSRQEGATSADPLVRAVVGADLRVLGWPESPQVTFEVAAEDGLSASFSEERCIGRAMAARGVVPVSLEAVLEFVDQYPDDRPEIDGKPHSYTVREWFGHRFSANASFHDPATGYRFPSGWSFMNDEMRAANAAYLRGVSKRVLAGASLQEEYRRAFQFSRDSYEQFEAPQ